MRKPVFLVLTRSDTNWAVQPHKMVKPQSHIHDFGPGRATVHPDLASW